MNPSSFETSRYAGIRSLAVYLSLASQSIEGNYSVVNWSIYGAGLDGSWYYTKNIYLDLNGSRVYTGGSNLVQLGNGTYVASGQVTIYHNSDGTKSMGVGIGGTIYNYGVYQTGGGTTTLTTIPRASVPTMSSTNFNIGASSTIYTNRYSSSFTHTIAASFGLWSETLATGVTTSYAWDTSSIAADLYAQIPNANSGTGTLTLYTYNGATLIGTKTLGFTLNVINSNPTMGTWSYEDTNANTIAITGNSQYFIQGYSNLQINLTSAATALNSATLGTNAYTINYNGTTLYASGGVTIPANFNIGTVSVSSASLSVKDSRNNSTPATLTFSVFTHNKPIVSNITVSRINPDNTGEDGHLNISGTYTQFPVAYAVANSIQTLKYRYKLTTTETWGDWITVTPTTNTGGSFTYDSNLADTFNTESSYDFEVSAADYLDASTKTTILNSIQVALYIDVDNNIVSLGSIPTSPTAGKSYYKGNEILTIGDVSIISDAIVADVMDLVYPIGTIYENATDSTNPGTLLGVGTWVAITDKFLVGVGSTYAEGTTGGNPTHNHTSAAHSHSLSDAGYACINVNATGYWEYREVGTVAWDMTARRSVGAAAAASGSRSFGWALRGNTDSATPSATGTSSNIPPYKAVYMWYRTA